MKKMKLGEAWDYVIAASSCLFVDNEFFAGFDTIELEKTIDENDLWDLEVEGFATFDGYLKIIAYHSEG